MDIPLQDASVRGDRVRATAAPEVSLMNLLLSINGTGLQAFE
jgi:hypothetical protein